MGRSVLAMAERYEDAWAKRYRAAAAVRDMVVDTARGLGMLLHALAGIGLAAYLVYVAYENYRVTGFGCRRAVQSELDDRIPAADPEVVRCRTGDDGEATCFVKLLRGGAYRTEPLTVDCTADPPVIK